MPPLRLRVTKHSQRVASALIRTWVVASVALLVVTVVMRLVNGPVHDDAWWWTAAVTVWGAPLWYMLLGLVAGWLWFVLFLLTWPFKPLRDSRIMKSISPDRGGHPPE